MEGNSGQNSRSEKARTRSDKTKEGHKGWYVIADTHLGLAPNREDVQLSRETCDPKPLGQFMDWLTTLKKPYRIRAYDPEGHNEDRRLEPPGKLIMLGDMYDLWDSTDWEAEFCGREFFRSVDRLDCDKIYIIGNHDIGMEPLTGTYASGKGEMRILDKPYSIKSPNQKHSGAGSRDKRKQAKQRGSDSSKYLFMHGQEFETSYKLPLWKHVDVLRIGAQALGDYWNPLIFFTVLGLLLYLGFDIGAWLSIFLLTLLYDSYSQKWVVYSWLLLLPLFVWTRIDVAHPPGTPELLLIAGLLFAIGLVVLHFADRGGRPTYLLPRGLRNSPAVKMFFYVSVYLLSAIVLPVCLFWSPALNASITLYLYPISGLVIFCMFLGAVWEHFFKRRKIISYIPRLLVGLIVAVEVAALVVTLLPKQALEQFSLSTGGFLLSVQQVFLWVQQFLGNYILRDLPLTPLWSTLLFIIWLVLVLPRIVYVCGIHLIRTFGSIRYNYSTPIDSISGWLYPYRGKWGAMKKRIRNLFRQKTQIEDRFFAGEGGALQEEDLGRLTLVYGHTHIIDEWYGNIKEKEESSGPNHCLNVPSWVKDETRGEEFKHEVRNAILYIDPNSPEDPTMFVGWDSIKSRPFHIPFLVLDKTRLIKSEKEKKAKKKSKIERKDRYIDIDTGVLLLERNWPLKMMLEWIGWFNCAVEGKDIEKEVMGLIERRGPIKKTKTPQPEEIVETKCCKKLLHYEDISEKLQKRSKKVRETNKHKSVASAKRTKPIKCPICSEKWRYINRQHIWLKEAKKWQKIYNRPEESKKKP
nr:hypothetical protein [Candidatus Njordarchaeota archaeon]